MNRTRIWRITQINADFLFVSVKIRVIRKIRVLIIFFCESWKILFLRIQLPYRNSSINQLQY